MSHLIEPPGDLEEGVMTKLIEARGTESHRQYGLRLAEAFVEGTPSPLPSLYGKEKLPLITQRYGKHRVGDQGVLLAKSRLGNGSHDQLYRDPCDKEGEPGGLWHAPAILMGPGSCMALIMSDVSGSESDFVSHDVARAEHKAILRYLRSAQEDGWRRREIGLLSIRSGKRGGLSSEEIGSAEASIRSVFG